jgi:glycine dehydrogenase
VAAPFLIRHLGPGPEDQQRMLAELGLASLEDLAAAVVPADILLPPEAAAEGLPSACSEAEALAELAAIAAANGSARSLIGLGYFGTATPALIQRHVLENPCWYTAYTPYQAEIAQGRLEALLNFQTLVSELTGLPIANASLLDEGTAAAEAMALAAAVSSRRGAQRFLVDRSVLPQTLAVLATRAEPLGIVLESVDLEAMAAALAAQDLNDLTEATGAPFPADAFGLLIQLPGVEGRLWDPAPLLAACRAEGLISAVAIDPPRPGAAGAGGPSRCRHRRGQPAALRGADGFRRSPRRLLRHQRGLQASDPRPSGRPVQGCRGQPRPAPGPADPRTAHPPRQGHQQYLHRPGAAGGDGQFLCGASRPRWA